MAWFLPVESYLSELQNQCCYLEQTLLSGTVITGLLECQNPDIFLFRDRGGQMEGKQPLLLTLLCNTEKPEKKTWDCIKTPKMKLYGGVYFLKSSTREQDRHDSTTHKDSVPTGRLCPHQ